MSKDLEKLKTYMENLITTQIQALKDELPALILKTVRDDNRETSIPTVPSPIPADLDLDFLTTAPAAIDALQNLVNDHTQQLENIGDTITTKIETTLPSNIDWSCLKSVPEQLHQLTTKLSSISDDISLHTVKLKSHSEQLDTIRSDHSTYKQNQKKEFENFTQELSDSRLSSIPTVASALTDLTKVVQNLSTVQESVTNKPTVFLDPSCATFLHGYVHYVRYRLKNGSQSFLCVLKNSPSVYSIFMAKIHSRLRDFVFPPQSSDTYVLKTILNNVFYPEGFTVEGFQLLITTYSMETPITIQSAYKYALFVKDFLFAMDAILPSAPAAISQFWIIVYNGVDRTHSLHYKLKSEHPQQYQFFYTSLERKIIAFFESTPTPRPLSDSNSPPLSTYSYQKQSGGAPSTPLFSPSKTLGTPSNARFVASLSSFSEPCDNCQMPGHSILSCPREFCRPCQTEQKLDFYHRPQDCMHQNYHDDEG